MSSGVAPPFPPLCKGSPTEKVAGSIRALPKWGGSKRLLGWFGALINAVKIEVQMAFAQFGPEIKCPRVPV